MGKEFSRPVYWSRQPFPSPGNLPNPGIEPRSPALQMDSLPAEPQGKPKNTGVGCHFLLQVIFPTQGSNPGLLHCRWILCHLSHQGSPSSHYPSPQCHTWVSHHRGPRWVYAVATQTWQALRLERVSFREWVLYLHMCLLNRGKIEIFSILNKQK